MIFLTLIPYIYRAIYLLTYSPKPTKLYCTTHITPSPELIYYINFHWVEKGMSNISYKMQAIEGKLMNLDKRPIVKFLTYRAKRQKNGHELWYQLIPKFSKIGSNTKIILILVPSVSELLYQF